SASRHSSRTARTNARMALLSSTTSTRRPKSQTPFWRRSILPERTRRLPVSCSRAGRSSAELMPSERLEGATYLDADLVRPRAISLSAGERVQHGAARGGREDDGAATASPRDDASTRGIEAGGAPLGGLLPALNTAVECRRVSKAVEQPEMKREDVGLPASPRVELGEQRYGPLEDDRVGNSLWRQ